MAISPDGDLLYALTSAYEGLSAQSVLERIRTDNGQVTTAVELPGAVDGMAMTPDGGSIFIARAEGLDVFSTVTQQTVGRLELPPDTFPRSSQLKMSPRGSRLYVTYGIGSPAQISSARGAVALVDTSTLTIRSTTDYGLRFPVVLAVTADGGQVFVSNNDFHLAGDVSVVDYATNRIVGSFTRPSGFDWTMAPKGDLAFVSDGTVLKLFDTATREVVGERGLGQSV